MNQTTVQRLRRTYSDPTELAIRYFSIISAVNGLGLSGREIELLAFTAIRGTISSVQAKEAFSKRFDSSVSTVNNMISKLSKLSVLVKIAGKTKVHPALALNFSKPLHLQIDLKTREEDNEQVEP